MKIEFRQSEQSIIPFKPSFHFLEDEYKEKYWMLGELYMCDVEYILDDVLPNIEKIWNGEKYWDEYRSPTYGAFDSYEFGYDATLIDFGKEKSVISYGFGDGEIEVPSEDIYTLMQEWGKHLVEWKLNNPV
jgi:hypothetical protein